MKRKAESNSSDTQFKFWGIVISRWVWNFPRSTVAEKFGCTESYVTQVMNKFNNDEGYIDHRQFNGGQNKKVKESLQKLIVKEYRENPSSTSIKITTKCSDLGYDVADRTIRKVRLDIGLVAIKPTVLPILSNTNCKDRLKYCKDHKDDLFSNVCFSDESCFQLFPNKKVVWYLKGEDSRPTEAVPKQNKKIMIWGGISRRGKTPLHIYRLDKKETVTSRSYIDCLDENLLETMNKKYGEGLWRFLQDNAKPHTAKETKEYLDKNNVRVLFHPAYSPDLNPIEHVWAWMKHDITSKSYNTVEDLISAVEKKWESLTIELQNKLIDHHTKMIEKVHKNKGNYV